MADHCAVRFAKKNHGISQAEDKLWLFIGPLIGMVIGLLMMGLGPYYSAHWIVFVLGCSIVNFCGPIATAISLAYAFDCFHPVRPDSTVGPQAAAQDSSPYLLSVIFLGMTIAFGFVSWPMRFCLKCQQRWLIRRDTQSPRGVLRGVTRTLASRRR